MTTFVDIRTALLAPIFANNEFDIDFDTENKSSDDGPTIDVPHASFTMLPGQPDQIGLGVNGCDEHGGFAQISLFYPANEGDLPLLIKADEIAAVYKSGADFVSNGVTVTIDSIGISASRPSGGWFQSDLTINYFSFIRRT